MSILTLTEVQRRALKWLAEHNGEGAFVKKDRTKRAGQILLAAGEAAPHTRATWNRLRDLGLAEITPQKRIHLTQAGKKTAASI